MSNWTDVAAEADLFEGAGIAVAGLAVSQGLERFRMSDRSVTVKGLAEKDVESDFAIWTLSFRRAGNEFLFQMQAMQNVEMLNEIKAKKIVVTCPHCMNAIGNEYRQLGGDYRKAIDIYSASLLLDPENADLKAALRSPRHCGMPPPCRWRGRA